MGKNKIKKNHCSNGCCCNIDKPCYTICAVECPRFSSKKLYRVRKSWDDEKSQLLACSTLEEAKDKCKYGYYVFDWLGNRVFPDNDKGVAYYQYVIDRCRKKEEKLMPKFLNIDGLYHCPVCGYVINDGIPKQKYCDRCGQALL